MENTTRRSAIYPDPQTHPAKDIASLNDTFRRTFQGGTVLATAGVKRQGDAFLTQALTTVRSFNDFTGDNDPHGEYDFGAFTLDGQKLFWKIDYYDSDIKYGSEDPADPTVTQRVLTVMMANEY